MKLSSLARSIALAAAALAGAGTAAAQSTPVKIGLITTLSTPSGYLGEEIRDGFALAIRQEGGKLGGVPVELVVGDDAAKPEIGKQLADRMAQKDGVRLFTGIVFSNVALAVVPDLAGAGHFYLSANAGPHELAGKGCLRNYWSVGWQNDNQHEAAGAAANAAGIKRVVLLAPNYAAGKDALAGFRRTFKGEVVDEVLTKLGQTDYAVEIAELRSKKPEAVFFFLPGGMGINFIKQVGQARLANVRLLAPMTVDERVLAAVGDAGLGLVGTSFWGWDMANPASQQFVAAYREAYKKLPTTYAAQGYDTARLLASALKATGGDLARADALRAALTKADFASVRGAFRFGPNRHPIQDWYVRDSVKGADGVVTTKLGAKVLSQHGDAYAAECKQ